MIRVALIAGALALAWPTPADAAVERYGIFIGNNTGDADEQDLRYAEDDAEKLHRVLGNVGGFRPENIVLLRGKPAATVRRTLIALNDRIRSKLRSGRDQAVLFVYYSGHADAEALHLGGSALELSELEALVRGSAATVRLLVVDACRSGAITRVKGGSKAPKFKVQLDERLAGEGVVLLTSASANEDAHESDALKGSFFTHYLVSGLLGAADTNGDGRVVLDEAYRFAYENTLRASSRALTGTQHPTFRYDLRGRGNVVLSTLNVAGRARLGFPAGKSYLIMKRSKSGPIVAEVGVHDRVRSISVPPGRYFVRARARSHLLEGHVTATAGARTDVRDGALSRIEYARLARKGSGPVDVVRSAQVGFRIRTPLASGDSMCTGAFFGYPFELRYFNLTPRIGACSSSYDNDVLTGTTRELDAELRLSHAWDLPVVTLDVGAAAGFAVLRQSFDAEPDAPARTIAAGELGVSVGALTDLPNGFYVAADVAGITYLLRTQQSFPAVMESFEPVFAVRASAALGKRW